MFNLPESQSIHLSRIGVIIAIVCLLWSGDVSAQQSGSSKSVVERTGPRGRTIAFRPLNDKNMKKGLKYQVFETTISGVSYGDTTLRDSLVTLNDVHLTKTTDGYLVSSTPKSVKRFVNNTATEDPMSQLVVGITAKLHLNTTGSATDFTGLDAIQTKLNTLYPPDSATAIMKSIAGSNVKMRVMGEWNGRLANLLNREMVIGDARFDTGQIQLPNGHRLQSFIVSRIEDTIRIQGVWHVKVRVTAATNPKDISTVSELPFRDILRGFKMADSTLASYPMSKGAMIMKTELLLEMNTLLLKTEEFSRTFYMEPELQNNQPVYTRTMSYQRSLRYQYQ